MAVRRPWCGGRCFSNLVAVISPHISHDISHYVSQDFYHDFPQNVSDDLREFMRTIVIFAPGECRTQVRTGPVWTISADVVDDADDGDEFREAIFSRQDAWFRDIYLERYVQNNCYSKYHARAMPRAEHQALKQKSGL